LIVTILVSTIVGLFRLRQGNARYLAYMLAFMTMTACPIVTFIALDAPPIKTEIAPVRMKETTSTLLTTETDIDAFTPKIGQPGLSREPSYQVPSTDYKSSKIEIHTPETTQNTTTTNSITFHKRVYVYVLKFIPLAMAVWMIGVVILSGRLLLGLIGILRWRRHLKPLPDNLIKRVYSLCEKQGIEYFSRVFISPSAIQAMAVGCLRPMILLPAALVVQMQPEMLEAVIAHELAHIRRFDLWVNLFQRVIETLLFYHPAVWWLSHRMRVERELCCDELAVRITGEPLTYASALENAVRAVPAPKQPLLSAGFGRTRKLTLNRIRHVLGLAPTPPTIRFWLAGIITLTFITALAVPSIFIWQAENSNLVASPTLLGHSIEESKSDPNSLISNNFKVSLERAEYEFSNSVRSNSGGQRKQAKEDLEFYCKVDVLDTTSLVTLGISQIGAVTHFENEKGEVVDITDQAKKTSWYLGYEAPPYRSEPVVLSKPIKPDALKKQRENNSLTEWTDVLEPVRMRLELDSGLLGRESKKINHLKGYFYALIADSIEYIDIPFEPNETWVRLTPEVEIQVLEAESSESNYKFRIETRRDERAFRDISPYPGSHLPNRLPVKQELLNKHGNPFRGSYFPHQMLNTFIGGRGSGSGKDMNRIEKIRFAIAVNPSHHKIPFELKDIPLPESLVAATVQVPKLPATQEEEKAQTPTPPESPVITTVQEPNLPANQADEKAHSPTPPNTPGGNIHRGTWITLSWKPGNKAVSHDVYLGDNFDDVNNSRSESFRGNQTEDFYIVGFPSCPYPDGLVPGTTYYWRIDEVNEAEPNSPWKGDVWSFTVKDKTESELIYGKKNNEESENKVEVVIAKISLPPWTVITNKDIETKVVAKSELPKGKLVKSLQIIGRVLAFSVVEGQVLTESYFVPEGIRNILSQVPRGMRGITVHISSKAMPDKALLYPGCAVDVLVTYKLSPRDSQGEAISTTMLRGIQVLAISDYSVVSNQQDNNGIKNPDSNKTRLTLLVDPKQAEALALAVQNGTLSLTLRNPLDKDDFDKRPSIVNRRRLNPGREPTILKRTPPMRPVAVPVSSKGMPDKTLIYPGCVVDVQVTHKLSPRDSQGEAISTTMLRGIQVLAVSDDSIVSHQQDNYRVKSPDSNGTRVILLVTPKQEEALNLAVRNGTLSLTLRDALENSDF
jgi:Flp pilus assembly protein CpaB